MSAGSQLDETGLPDEGCDDEDMAATWFSDDQHDLQEDVDGAPGEDALHDRLCATVRGLLYCDNDADHVAKQVLTLKLTSPAVAPIEALAAALSKLSPCRGVYIREAKGSPLKSMCLTRLRHKCILVSRPTTPSSPRSPLRIPDQPLIAELALKDALGIVDPTPRYQALLDLLPDVYVATEANFMATLQLVADEMKASFAEKRKEMPPWRTYPALSSKWSSHTSVDTPLLPPVDPTAPHPPVPAYVPANRTATTTSVTVARRPGPHEPPPPTPYPFHPPCMAPGKQSANPVAPLCTTTFSSSMVCAAAPAASNAVPTTTATTLASTPPFKSTPRASVQPANPAILSPANQPPPLTTPCPSLPITLHLAPNSAHKTPNKPPAPRSALQAFFPLPHHQPPAPSKPRPHLLVGATNPKLTSFLTASLRTTLAAGAPAAAGCKAATQSAHRRSAAVAASPAPPPPVGHGATGTAGSPGYFFLAEAMET